MDKEEFISNIKDMCIYGGDTIVANEFLNKFFNSNVVIPKGGNRHPYADVLHAFAEDTTKELQEKHKSEIVCCGYLWKDKDFSLGEIRIKPSEPTFEYKVRMMYSDGSYEDTERYFTQEEYEAFGFPKTCMLEDDTKRARQ